MAFSNFTLPTVVAEFGLTLSTQESLFASVPPVSLGPAEMVAAQRFNRNAKSDIETVYGLVTTGNNGLFHRLHGTTLAIDTREYLISEVDQILGILLHIVGLNPVVNPTRGA